MKETVKNILYRVADISYEIVENAEPLEESLPPHNEYVVNGDLIRKLAEALKNLEQEENESYYIP